ncbi:hypothetical protein POJ06DRAFT_199295 [Lipomyces tetrasporus]|uniref:Ubiquitin carboxyl-terminal hydrolase n=1 Tax=Lipomyces tetrasporus TaxID=54092 RepID=A0AAD7QPD8_9ASCO|nr:uncharacterized protein POJ06DRAFT_199295 [Lipomyces tetrasporus]KAJ8099147.1 hypothetical protein POJ06DRAFT_199295 [Lipomyces tetrasporus]
MIPSLHDHGSHLAYAGFAALASLAIYVLMPSLPTVLSAGSEDKSPGSSAFSRNSRYVVGLYNKANDCFANSVLQALASSPSLRHYLDDSRFQDQPLSAALKAIIRDLNTPIRYPRSVSPWPFLHVLEVIYNSRITRSQHDAHELLHLILETITDEHDKVLKELLAAPKVLDNDAELEDEKVERTINVTREFMPFQGTTVDTIRCLQCGNSPKPKSTNFIVLTLNVPQKWSATLEDCMASLFSSEPISDYGCQSCRLKSLSSTVSQVIKKAKLDEPDSGIVTDLPTSSCEVPDFVQNPVGYLHYLQNLDPSADLHPEIEARLPKSIKSTIVRTTSWGHLPDMFTCHLSRSIFSSTATRNSCRVSFPEELTVYSSQNAKSKFSSLSLGNLTEAQSTYEGSKTYRLVAMVRHVGTHSAGHYECYRRKEMFKDYDQAATAAALTASSPLTADAILTAEPAKTASSGLLPTYEKSSAMTEDALLSPKSGSRPESESNSLGPSRGESPSRLQSRARSRTATKKLYRQFTGGRSWWRISDEKVWECTTDEVLRQTQSAYLLVYERIPPYELETRSSSRRRSASAQKL